MKKLILLVVSVVFSLSFSLFAETAPTKPVKPAQPTETVPSNPNPDSGAKQAGGGKGTIETCAKCGGKYLKELQHLGKHVCPAPKDTVNQGKAAKVEQVGSCSKCGSAISEGKTHVCKSLLDKSNKAKE